MDWNDNNYESFWLGGIRPWQRPQVERKAPPNRAPELFTQAGIAQGVWYHAPTGQVGILPFISAWPGSQIVIKGRGVVGRLCLVRLSFSYFSDFGEVIYLIPRIEKDIFPAEWESVGFDLPPFILSGVVQVEVMANGQWSNKVRFNIGL